MLTNPFNTGCIAPRRSDATTDERSMKRNLYQHLPKLAILDLLAQTGSFRATSARAHVTQSALSQNISALESIFGVPLLVREGGSVRPTTACLALLERVRPALRVFDDLAQDVGKAETERPDLGSLDLGSYESLAISVLPVLTRRLRAVFPDLRLTVKIGRSGELLRLVRKGELCMAITTELDAMDGLTVMPLADDRLGVFVAAGHPLAEKGRAALDGMIVGSLASAKEGHPRYFARYLRALKLSKFGVVSESFEALRAMAAEGAIAAVLPTRVAHRRRASALAELDLGTAPSAGRHKILLVSPKSCDLKESEYLAGELRTLFADQTVSLKEK